MLVVNKFFVVKNSIKNEEEFIVNSSKFEKVKNSLMMITF